MNILPAFCRMAALPYPAYGIAAMHHPARFCRPDKRSAIRHVLGARIEHPARFLPDGGVPPYPAYGFAVMHHPARFCRPDKRSAIRHVFGSQGRTSRPLYCRMAAYRLIRPTGSQPYITRYGFVGLISAAPSGMFLEQGSSTLPALLPDGGVALSGLRTEYLCPLSASFFVIFTNALQ